MKRFSHFLVKTLKTHQLYSVHVRLSSTNKIYGQCEPNSFSQRTHNCGQLNSTHIGQKVELCGWLKNVRLSLFMILRDTHGTTQVTIPEDERLQNLMSQLSKESVLRVVGTVQPRPEDQCNKDMATGDIEVLAEDVTILSTAGKTLPFQVQDFHKVTEPLRMEYRYLDLRNSTMQRNLRLRSQMVMKMREYLCNKNGFIEVETPTLFRKTPGGAREFLVPTHHKGKYYSLPQSPQQFKQLLMVGGIDRYMQIARCYRDETANPDRQPEFTQVDLEMSFVTPDNVKGLIEGMLSHSWPADHESLITPFPVMNFEDAIRDYGSDKPDTRFELKLQDISKLLEGCNPDHVSVLEAADNHPLTSVQALNFKRAAAHLSNKDIQLLKKETHIPGVVAAQVQ